VAAILQDDPDANSEKSRNAKEAHEKSRVWSLEQFKEYAPEHFQDVQIFDLIRDETLRMRQGALDGLLRSAARGLGGSFGFRASKCPAASHSLPAEEDMQNRDF
jgi:hypothetical protein